MQWFSTAGVGGSVIIWRLFFLRHCLLCLFIYFWLCWVFVSLRGLSLVVASGGRSSSRCAGLSPSRPLPLRGTGSRRAGSVIVAHGPSCSVACRIFPDQGSNPCPLHWQADSQPLRHQGSPEDIFDCWHLGVGCCWHGVGRGQGYCSTSCVAQDSFPQQRII